jgi:hypothetical protein
MRRDAGRWITLERDVIPAQRPRLFRPDAGGQRQDHMGAEILIALRHAQQRRRLVRGHCPGRTPGLARRRFHQRGHIAPDVIRGLGMPDRRDMAISDSA